MVFLFLFFYYKKLKFKCSIISASKYKYCVMVLMLFLLDWVVVLQKKKHYFYWRSVARNFSSTASREASDRSVACMYFWTPTRDFFNASNELEYNIFFLTYNVD